MSALGRLVIELSADTVSFASDLGRAARISEQRAQEISKALTIATGAVTALAAAGAVLAKSAINDMDSLNKLSQRVGVSVEKLSGLKYAAELADVSTEALGVGLKKLSVNMLDTQAGTGNARDAFKALGIAVTDSDGKLKRSDEVLSQVADRFARMEDGAGKTALAVKLFGKSGADLIPLLNQGAAGLASAATEAERFGLTVTSSAAKAAEDFNDNLTRLSKTANGLGIAIATPLLPNLVSFTNQLRDAAAAAGGFWKALANPAVNNIADPGPKILEMEEKLASMKKLREELSTPTLTNKINDFVFGDVKDLNIQIAAMEKQLAVLRSMQDIKLERLTVESIHRTKVEAPALPDDTKGPKLISFDELMARGAAAREKMYQEAEDKATQTAQRIREENDRLARSYRDLIDPVQKYRDELVTLDHLKDEGLLSAEETAAAMLEIQEKIDQSTGAMQKFTDESRKTNDVARDLGMTFVSAFEDAAINGKKFSDVLKNIEQDIARIILRKAVTEPLAGALVGMLSPLTGGISGLFSGLFKAEGGPVSGGQPYIVGERGPELFVPKMGGTVIPNDDLARAIPGSSGGDEIHVHLNIQMLDPRTGAHVILQNMPLIAAALRKAAGSRGYGTPF